MTKIINVWYRMLVGNPEGRERLGDIGIDAGII
jgi:hypothetical protein